MKKALIIATILITATTSSVWADFGFDCPTDGSSKEYLCRRFVKFNIGQSLFSIDLQDVSSAIFDAYGYEMKAQHPTLSDSQLNPWKSAYWLYMKNGTKIYFVSTATCKTLLDNYRTFLVNNPQYLTK